MAHVFRFFVDVPGSAGQTAALSAPDVHHLRVLRAQPGDALELVDAQGVLWSGVVGEPGHACFEQRLQDAEALPQVVLYAGLLTGQRWDSLVDGTVQTGVARIVPIARRQADIQRADDRLDRMRRVARAAAQQAKRSRVPEVTPAIDARDVLTVAGGIVLATGDAPPLADACGAPAHGEQLRLLVGPAEGLDARFVDGLEAAGWRRASLGPTVLRSELAAAVAVATVVQRSRPSA